MQEQCCHCPQWTHAIIEAAFFFWHTVHTSVLFVASLSALRLQLSLFGFSGEQSGKNISNLNHFIVNIRSLCTRFYTPAVG